MLVVGCWLFWEGLACFVRDGSCGHWHWLRRGEKLGSCIAGLGRITSVFRRRGGGYAGWDGDGSCFFAVFHLFSLRLERGVHTCLKITMSELFSKW